MTVIQANEIERLKRELTDARELPIAREFADRVGRAIMTILATRPLNEWPPIARTAFDHEAKPTTNSARIYRRFLPQTEE